MISRILPGGDASLASSEEKEDSSKADAAGKKEKTQKETLSLALAYPESGTEDLSEAQTENARSGGQTEESSLPDEKQSKEFLPETESEGRKEEIRSLKESETPAETDQADQEPAQGQLGVQVREFSKEDQIIYRIPAGVVIAEVTDGSGARAAGLVSGDLITGINGERVTSVDELKAALLGLKAGDKVKVTFIRPDESDSYREGNEMNVTVTLQ